MSGLRSDLAFLEGSEANRNVFFHCYCIQKSELYITARTRENEGTVYDRDQRTE